MRKVIRRERYAVAWWFMMLLLCAAPAITLCKNNAAEEEPLCGLDPRLMRAFSQWSKPPTAQMVLVAAFRDGLKSMIHISQMRTSEARYFRRAYTSSDHGNTWLEDFTNTSMFGNLRSLDSGTVAGITDNYGKVRWRSKGRTVIEWSLDGGQSWEEISPVLNSGAAIAKIELICTGKHDEGRIYAGISLKPDDGDYALYRSDDYGRSFAMISTEVLYAVESASERDIMIGFTRGGENLHHEIVVSENGGKTWEKTRMDIVIDRVDQYPYNPRPVKQIESDSQDPHTFYVLTWTGVYATRDFGKTFRLMPLATEFVFGVDNIAVDPVDSRFIYAIVKSSEFYRSSDKGCTWEKIQLPQQP